MVDARSKWNAKYATADRVETARPCTALRDFAHLLPRTGRALDVACGLGGNAIFLAGRGLDTLAVDISDVALDRLSAYAANQGLPLRAQRRDLEGNSVPLGSYDVIVVAYYLERALMPALTGALAAGGILFYQTFTLETPTQTGPSNPGWRLMPSELLQLCSGLRIIAYREEGLIGDTSLGMRGEAYLIARHTVD